MKRSENETTIRFDYKEEDVLFFTTRRGVKNNLVDRVGEKNITFEHINYEGDNPISWNMRVPEDKVRNPYYVTKVVS